MRVYFEEPVFIGIFGKKRDIYMKDEKEIMKESMQNFDEVYADFGKDVLNEDISETTVSEEEFQQEWHRIVDEVFAEQYGNS